MNNTNINYKRALPSPEELKKEIPISKEIEKIKLKRDQEIDDVLASLKLYFDNKSNPESDWKD